MSRIDISGIDKAELLSALYNRARAHGFGRLSPAGIGSMSVSEAQEIVETHTLLDFDYLRGRSFKVNIKGDTFDPWLYDRDNGGEGTAAKVIARLRDN